ncbi:uncharacterized protein [Antedon mediterranea]|uniref:uncharacterized protein n=1 Tax=Antedon mediterranea TaxID=105859 RepID=UPI003AF90709
MAAVSGWSSDDSEDEIILSAIILAKRRKRKWVKEVCSERKTFGQFETLVKRNLATNEDEFFNYFRMTPHQYGHLVSLIKDDITKRDTRFRESISAEERLSICLRYLATGDSYPTMYFAYRVGKSTICKIISEVCQAIWDNLKNTYMAIPSRSDWKQIAEEFNSKWNFPNCIGAIDGKHVQIVAPDRSGSLFYNYKSTHSVVLLALVDADYCFSFIDVGNYGSNSDGGIFARSDLNRAITNKTLEVPEDVNLPGSPELGPMPHVILGDEAFPLKTNIMRPYPGKELTDEKRIFNYRLSRGRRISENVFGQLAAKYRIYFRVINMHPKNVDKIIKATCVLHNYIKKTSDRSGRLPPTEDVDLSQYEGIQPLRQIGNHAGVDAMGIRDAFKDYFNSPNGEVVWQRKVCFGHASI